MATEFLSRDALTSVEEAEVTKKSGRVGSLRVRMQFEDEAWSRAVDDSGHILHCSTQNTGPGSVFVYFRPVQMGEYLKEIPKCTSANKQNQ